MTLCKRLFFPLVLLASSLPVAAHPVQTGGEVDELLARARAAIGWDRLIESGGACRVSGAARFLGSDAEQVMLFDGRGRFVQSLEGQLSMGTGFDGETAWEVDWSGTPRTLVLGDRANAEVSQRLLTGGWSVDDGLLDFELAADSEAGQLRLDFVHSDGFLVGELSLDADTLHLRSASFGTGAAGSRWTFEDWSEHDGFWFPSRIVLAQEGLTQDLRTATVETAPTFDEALFRPRLERPLDVEFDAEVGAEIEVKRVPTGHLLVQPTVDGEDLGWFIFDSGAGINCISTHVAEALPEGPFGEIKAKGIGGTVSSRFWRARELTLGPVTVRDPLFMGLDLSFLAPHFGVEVAGIVGYELLARCTVEFDMSAGRIALFDPSRYELPAGGAWEEVLLYGKHPCVRASFEDQEGVFKIDTGAANETVTMHYQVVADLGLVEGRETRAAQAGGVGGQVATRAGVLTSFELGGHRFEALPASFTVEDKGAFADDYVWGNIGGKLIAPFRLVFDYPGERVGFVPRD